MGIGQTRKTQEDNFLNNFEHIKKNVYHTYINLRTGQTWKTWDDNLLNSFELTIYVCV